jgi:hypothetical protein
VTDEHIRIEGRSCSWCGSAAVFWSKANSRLGQCANCGSGDVWRPSRFERVVGYGSSSSPLEAPQLPCLWVLSDGSAHGGYRAIVRAKNETRARELAAEAAGETYPWSEEGIVSCQPLRQFGGEVVYMVVTPPERVSDYD